MSEHNANPPAGWYHDPSAPEQQRWWDGAQWTSSIRPLHDTPPPAESTSTLPPPTAYPSPDPFTSPSPTEPPPAGPPGGGFGAPPAPAPGTPPPGTSTPAGTGGSGGRGMLVVGAVAGVLLLGGCVAVLAVGSDDGPSESVTRVDGDEPIPPPENDEEDGGFGSVGSGGDSDQGGESDPDPGAVDPFDEIEPADQGTRADPLPYDQPVDVTWHAFGAPAGSIWTTTVGAPADVTDDVLAANQFNDPPPDGVVFAGFPVSMTLVEAAEEPLAPGFTITFEVLGGATARVYDFTTIETESFGCGVVSGEFDEFAEAFVGGTLSGTVCIPIPVEDLDHPDTRVALSFLTGQSRAIFGP